MAEFEIVANKEAEGCRIIPLPAVNLMLQPPSEREGAEFADWIWQRQQQQHQQAPSPANFGPRADVKGGKLPTDAEVERWMQQLRGPEALSLEDAYALLAAIEARDHRITSRLPTHPSASPLAPARLSYIVRRGCGVAEIDDDQGIHVTFQSVVNADVWWSNDGTSRGVVARPMSRSTPGRRGAQQAVHGYKGRAHQSLCPFLFRLTLRLLCRHVQLGF